MMTYTEAVAHITYALGNRTDIATMCGRWWNWAYLDMWEYTDAHNREDISTGALTIAQNYLTIPDGTYSIERVVIGDAPLERREWREYTDITAFASAKPTKYYIFGTKIYFDTAPDDDYAYEVWRIKTPTELSGSSQPALPLFFEPAMVSRALAYGYRELQMPQDSDNWFQISTQQIQSIKQQHWKENEDWNSRGLRLNPNRRTR